MESAPITPPRLGYELLDSGAGKKLERFGDKRIIRPSSLCIWNRRLAEADWKSADAEYDHKAGWKFRAQKFEEWDCTCDGFTLRLRTQDNGQVGFFPEHSLYMPKLEQVVRTISGLRTRPARVLNLFAYTGMASIVVAKAGGHVTHVDLSKKALDWASINFGLNSAPAGAYRLIREDAGEFVERESRRGNKYDIIITDPPSFSRVTAKKTWQLEEVIVPMTRALTAILESDRAALFFTCHHADVTGPTVSNLLFDFLPTGTVQCEQTALTLRELKSGRVLPAGSLVSCTLGLGAA